MSILIVDDSASQRILLASLLKAAGYADLAMAASADEALDRLAESSSGVELVLMDVTMPQVDGISACRRIKERPEWRDLPIIMITASRESDDLEAAFDAGAMDYITKPPNTVDLRARVQSALKLKCEMDRRKAEQAKSERLLLNILPAPVAERLKRNEGIIADSFDEVTVLFADIVGFTQLAAVVAAHDIVVLLNDIFSRFDLLTEKHGLEKIKTIGDAYMVVGGLPTPRADHAEAIADMALDMLAAVAEHARETAGTLSVRIGMHTGPVVAGVIGTRKFSYDLWGDTVNVASRMEATGVNGSIQVTPETHRRLQDRFTFEERAGVMVKGKGSMTTYVLTGRR
jgi:adenylate cyclase